MIHRLLEKDLDLLETLEAYRILTLSQVAHLHGRTRQMARRRVLALRMAGLIASVPLTVSGRRGRPEQVLYLTRAGTNLLHEKRPEIGTPTADRPGDWSPLFLRHDLLVNWFRIHLARIDEIQQQIQTWFLPPDIVNRARIHSVGVPGSSDEAGRRSGKKQLRFVPDGVFALIDRETKKAALFFLEVDMGTRPVASAAGLGRDAREKILNYRAYHRSGGYKVYERILGAPLSGFRLLFLTDTAARQSGLCLLCATMGGPGFVWATDRESMFSDGLAAAIWVVGGDTSSPLRSIIGPVLCCKSSLPPLSR